MITGMPLLKYTLEYSIRGMRKTGQISDVVKMDLNGEKFVVDRRICASDQLGNTIGRSSDS